MKDSQPTFRRSKHDKQNPYVMISRDMLHDKSISPKAKGVLCYLLSLPNDWQVYHKQLMQALDIGEDYLNSSIDELIKTGYAKRSRQRVNGLFQPYIYEISENKIFLPEGENQPGSSSPENPDILKNEYPTDTKKEETKDCSSSFSDQEIQMQKTLQEAGLTESSIKTILSLKCSPEALKVALDCADAYKPDDIGSYVCRAIQNKWQPPKAIKSDEEVIAREKEELSKKIAARKLKAEELKKKYPGAFEIRSDRIDVKTRTGFNPIGFCDDEIEKYFDWFKGEK